MENKIDSTSPKIHDDSFDDFSIRLDKYIENIIHQEDYKTYRVEKKMIPQAGNFLSFLYEVDITGETADGEKVTSLFIKKSVTLDKITLANVSDVYYRENFIYKDFSEIIEMLQDAANVPDTQRFSFIKRYNSDNDTVIMENLSKKGFKTYDKTQVIPLRFAELSIIELAKFHALSYVMKQKIPKYFDDNIKVIEHLYDLDSDWQGFVHNICSVIVQVTEGEVKAKITNYAPRMIEIYHKYLKNNLPTNGCLCHGDYKLLNIMVKEVDGEPTAVKPIDYQLVCYGSPVNDFLFFIFTVTDREFRKKHLDYLKDIYFENFAKFLRYFDVDVNSTYSRQDFESDFEERLELGLVFGLLLSAFTFVHTEEYDVAKLSMSELKIVPDEMFADRVRGIIEDYIEWGYL